MKKLNYWKYCLILIHLILIGIQIRAQVGGWTKFGDMPESRYGHTVDEISGKIYVIGGAINEGDPYPTSSLVYDTTSREWSELFLFNNSIRGAHNSCVVDGKLYIVGGNDGVTTVATMEKFDPDLGEWTSKTSMPTDRGLAACAVIDDKIYVIGGIRGTLPWNFDWTGVNIVEVYDTKTDTWSKVENMPTKRWGCTAVAFNNKIYVFGGTSFSGSSPVYRSVEVYDPQTNTWTTKSSMSTARYCLTSCLLDSNIYVIGGWHHSSNGPIYDKVEAYDPIYDEWNTDRTLPAKLAVLSSIVINSKIYVFGGARTTHPNYGTSAIYEYDPTFNTPVAAGNVSGTWTLANSPYHINGEITIPNDSTLTIEPGVEVVFTGHHKFNVQGRLLAVGREQNPILFTAEDKTAGWHGIRFINTPAANDTSKIIHCSLKYGKANTGSGFDRCGGAILIHTFDKVVVSNCLFDSNIQSGEGWYPPEASPAIYIYFASPIIINSTFSNNSGSKGSAVGLISCPNAVVANNNFLNNSGAFGPIAVVSNSKGIVSGNIISNNSATWMGGGILIDCALTGGSTDPRVENNIIVNNQAPLGGGIVCYVNSNPVLINNTIAYNSAGSGGGIYCTGSSDPIFVNNILYENTASSSGSQVFINDNASDPIFVYNDIEGGKEGFEGTGAGTNYTGMYENNIDADPIFFKSTPDNYSLANSSPCIGTGIMSVEIAGVVYSAPPFCIMRNPRPSPAGTNPDIGACESSVTVGIEDELSAPAEFALYQNYPNPFNPTTNFGFRIANFEFVSFKIFNLLGREVATIVYEEKPAGVYEVTWNAANLPSGVYFYRLKAGSFSATKKLLLLK